jgi:hypothetical protein
MEVICIYAFVCLSCQMYLVFIWLAVALCCVAGALCGGIFLQFYEGGLYILYFIVV